MNYIDLAEEVKNTETSLSPTRIYQVSKRKDVHPSYGLKLGFYFMLLMEITIIIMTVFEFININVYVLIKQIQIALVFFLFWIYPLAIFGFKRNYYQKQILYMFAQAPIHLALFLLAQLTSDYHFVLCGSPILIVLSAIFQASYLKIVPQLSASLVWYYICMVLFYCYSDSGPHWYKVILVYIFALFIVCNISENFLGNKSIIEKAQLTIFLYVGCVFWLLALGVSFSKIWFAFTIIPHLCFLGISFFLCKNRQHLFGTLQIERQFKWKSQFSVSELITSIELDSNDYEEKKNKFGNCLKCKQNESTYCYDKCLHICLCGKCIPDLLAASQPEKCSICEKKSKYILQLRREKYKVNRLKALCGYKLSF